MDHVLCDFGKAYRASKNSDPLCAYPQSKPGFFKSLKPIQNAIETYNWLLSDRSFDVWILTAPSIKNPLCYTEKRLWVEEYLGLDVVNHLIISPDKSLLKGDYLIDDYASGKGQENFEGQLIHFGSEQFPDWLSVQKYFEAVLD